MDGAKIVFRRSAVHRDTVVVARAGGFATGGDPLAGLPAKPALGEGQLRFEALGLVAELVGGFHDLDPDRKGEGGTVAPGNRPFRRVEADPDGAGHGGGETGEPGVLEVVRSARFSRTGFRETERFHRG